MRESVTDDMRARTMCASSRLPSTPWRLPPSSFDVTAHWQHREARDTWPSGLWRWRFQVTLLRGNVVPVVEHRDPARLIRE
jgi:hypothetical protein